MLVRRRNLSEREFDTGWNPIKSIKKAVKSVGKAASSVAKVATKIPGVKVFTAPLALAADVAKGRNVARSIGRAGGSIVADARKSLPIAAGVVSFVPGAGTALASGLSAANALSQGKSLTNIAKEAAIGAVPGGQLARAAINAGASIAQGGNVLKSVAREGISYARSQVPGGELVQRGLNVVESAARGQNIAKAVAREGVSYASKAVGSQVSQLTKALPMPILRRPSFGLVPSISPENIGRVRSVVGVNRPNMRPVVSGAFGMLRKTAAFRPLAQNTRQMLLSVVPHMRGETAGLSASGAQWIVEKTVPATSGSSIAKALTGNPNRWTELRSINPKVMGRGADLVKKYGFPIYVGDVINLPASWIQVTAKPPAQTTPAQPSAATPPPVSMPAGNLAAQSQARVVLAAWGKSDGLKEALVTDYGAAPELGAKSWTARDVLQANSFANWWRRMGGPPAVADGNWSDELAVALNTWAQQKASQVTNSAMAAGGVVIPQLPTIINTPPASPSTPAPTPTPAATTTPSVLAPAGSTPTLTLPTVTISGGAPALPPPTSVVVSQASAPASSTPGGTGEPLNDNAKWGLWSAIGGAVASGAIQLMK